MGNQPTPDTKSLRYSQAGFFVPKDLVMNYIQAYKLQNSERLNRSRNGCFENALRMNNDGVPDNYGARGSVVG
jgi:hypothetical protein